MTSARVVQTFAFLSTVATFAFGITGSEFAQAQDKGFENPRVAGRAAGMTLVERVALVCDDGE